MQFTPIVCALIASYFLVSSSWAAERDRLSPGAAKATTGKIIVGPTIGGGAVLDPSTGGSTVTELNASDCRLDGGTVVVPGDDRCGKMGAAYCRKPNGWAACLTEQ